MTRTMLRMIRPDPRLAGVVGIVLALAGCYRHHRDDDVTVTAESLAPLRGGCVVQGTIRNDGDHTVRVFLSWRARDRDGDTIGFAEAEVRDLPRDGTRSFESTRFRDFDNDLIPCDRIARIRRSTSVFRD